ncbi:hypothetical protein DPMN_017202 [Dreissena polymorpha]|uniref:Uncharacterized protein n=1 Tax=Dreissena polymorpha TaxID=45954 RepID=A0A9D4NAZ2_DREPO|nr:hypothetical protein DPMN_017202 [Dreissena polymorpha]
MEEQHTGVHGGITCTLATESSNNAEDVVDKNDLNTQKQMLSTDDNYLVNISPVSKSSDVRGARPFHVRVLHHEGHLS